MRRPNLWHPGNVAQQRFDAIYHDPYPIEDLGPEMVGARPRGYARSVPPVERVQSFLALPPVAPPPTLTPLPAGS